MRGIDIIEYEMEQGEGILRHDRGTLYTLFDCMLCQNHPKINKLMFFINYSMINESEAAAIKYVRNNLNEN